MPADVLVITPATTDDVPLLLELIRELASYERLLDAVTATEEKLAAALFGPHPVAHAVIARAGGEVAGYALYFFNFSTFLAQPGLYLEDLYVRPGWRRRGIGRALLVDLARIAVARGCGRMEWSVLRWNEPALKTYKAIGAESMNEWLIERLTGDALRALANSTVRVLH